MRKCTILVDMDDVLENLCEVWVSALNDRYQTDVRAEQITEWDLGKAFPTLTKEQICAPLCEEAFWKRVTPLPGAVEYVGKLILDGHKVVVVTASHPDTIPLKLKHVLFRYFPFFTYEDVIVTSQKQRILGDILIDDAPHNLEGGNYAKLLMNAPHNRSFNEKGTDIIRVYDWREIYGLITGCAIRLDAENK